MVIYVLSILGATLMTLTACQSWQKQIGNLRNPASELGQIRRGFTSLQNLDANKKTVCAMTMNSDNEILTFQKHLNPDQFQFVEFVNAEFGWLDAAIEAKVKCDILVVSGHFGGTFFGDKGRLSLDDLERATCSKEGSGIFHSVKEVFLFGCNTLAGKDKDHRTPEEYVRILRADGFSQAQAEQIAAFRYSPLGNTFSDRMSRVFAGVPRIYGFTSVGPSGERVEPMINQYLDGKDYAKYLNSIDNKSNSEFLKALKYSAITQVPGATLTNSAMIPRCVLNDRSVGDSKKLRLVDELLMNPEKRLSHLGEIGDYLLKSKRNGSNRNLETELADKWSRDQGLRTDLRQILDQGIKTYPSLRLQMTDVGLYFGWLSASDVRRIGQEVVDDSFKSGLTIEGRDFMISLGARVGKYITFEHIKDLPLDYSLMNLLGATLPEDQKIHEFLANILKDPSQNVYIRARSASILGLSNSKLPLAIEVLVDIMKNEKVYQLRQSALSALSLIRVQDPHIQWEIVEILKTDQQNGVRMVAAEALGRIKPQDPQFVVALSEAYKKEPSKLVRKNIAECLEVMAPKNPLSLQIQAAWKKERESK